VWLTTPRRAALVVALWAVYALAIVLVVPQDAARRFIALTLLLVGVVTASVIGGLIAGIVTATLTTAVGWFAYLESTSHDSLTILALMLFAGLAAVGPFLITTSIASRERSRRESDLSDALSDTRTTVTVMQRALLPNEAPECWPFAVQARYLPADGDAVGGDWYAVIALDDERLGVAIGDAAGHGLSATTTMAACRYGARTLATTQGATPDYVLAELHRSLATVEPASFVTAVYGICDSAQGTWTFANAGHCPPLLRPKVGRTVQLAVEPAPPLGVGPPTYTTRTEAFTEGDTLILATDGLLESRTRPIDAGIEQLARACDEGPTKPDELCDFILRRLRPADQRDDIALLVVHYLR
jgi:serine phosphatase RsbU (regulator of sigma subunit)